MNRLCYFIALIVMAMAAATGHAQQHTQERLQVGDTLPSALLDRLENYDYKSERPDPLKGKLLLLDFWATSCTSCINAMPEMEKLQKAFEGELQILLVNTTESHEQIEARTRKYPRVKALGRLSSLPMHNGDSLWRRVFPYNSVPHHVWINASREVIAITYGFNANAENVRRMLAGEQPDFTVKENYTLDGYDVKESGVMQTAHPPLKTDVYHVFLPYDNRLDQGMPFKIDSVAGTFRKTYINREALNLYALASNRKNPDMRRANEISNKERLAWPKDKGVLAEWLKRNVYTYEVWLPLEWRDKQLPLMVDHLNSYFREKEQIEGVFENWTYTCYTIRQVSNRLSEYRSRETELSVDSTSGFRFRGVKKQGLRFLLKQAIESDVRTNPIALFFEWSDDGNELYDIELLINRLSDIESLRNALKPYGLRIDEEKRELPVFLLRDYTPPRLR